MWRGNAAGKVSLVSKTIELGRNAMKRLSRTDLNKRGSKLTLKRRLTLERLENRSLLAGFPIGIGGNGDETGWSVATDVSGNVFVAGSAGGNVDFDPGTGTANLNVSGGGFLAKYNADGTFAWVRNCGAARSLTVDDTGSAYVAGSYAGTLNITGIDRVNGSNVPYSSLSLKSYKGGGSNALVIKFGSTGVVADAWQFGGSSSTASASATSVAIDTANGGVYVAGAFVGTVDFNPDPASTAVFNQTSAGSNDAFVVKLNSLGSFGWAKRAGSTGNDSISGIASAADGSVYATGEFEGSASFFDFVTISSLGGRDGFVAGLSSVGTVNWVKSMGGGAQYDRGNGISVIGSNLYVTGGFNGGTSSSNNAVGFNNEILTSNGLQDGFLSSLNTVDGTSQWTKVFGGVDNDLTRSPAIDPVTGDIYITGYFAGASTIDFDPGAGQYLLTSTGQNGYVVKIHGDGSFGGWATQLKGAGGSSGSNSMSAVWDPSSNTVFATGSFSGTLVASTIGGPSGPTLTSINSRNGDVFVVKLAGGTGLPPSPLNAAASAPIAVSDSLSLSQVSPIFEAALAKWQATGADISTLRSADIRVANLGGSLLGLASGNTITLDDDAAGWGWFVDSTPGDDSDFLGSGNQGEMNRMDLLSVVLHELGHLLGHNHEADGLMAETLAAGVRSTEAEHDAAHGQLDGQMAAWLPDPVESVDARARRRR